MSSQAQPASNAQPKPPAKAEFEDCTPCRVMGSATFIGLGIYALTVTPEGEGTAAANAKPFVRAMTRYAPQIRGGFGAGFILLGLYRLVV